MKHRTPALVFGALLALSCSATAHADNARPAPSRLDFLSRLRPEGTPLGARVSLAADAGPFRPFAETDESLWSDEFGIPGLDGTPLCAAFFAGDLVVAGHFRYADGQRVNNIARWDGNEWQPMGEGFSSPVEALAVWNGRLVAGGGFYSSGATFTGPLAIWTGGGWEALGQNILGTVIAIAASDSDLVIGGWLDAIGTLPVRNVARWNGSEWDAMGGGIDGIVLDVAAYRGEWVVGGQFNNAGATAARGIARWDGNVWRALDRGVSLSYPSEPFVYTLAARRDELIAGGQFDSAGVVAAGGIARWNGAYWDSIPGAPRPLGVNTLVSDGDVVHVGGWFPTNEPPWNRCLARWDGASLTYEPGGPDRPPYAIALAGDDFVIAGAFERLDDRPMPRVARRSNGAWHPLASWRTPMRGLNGTVFDFARFDGRIVAVGSFSLAADDTGWTAVDGAATWDGTRWRAMGGSPGAYGSGRLTIHEGDLYVANGRVAKWNGAYFEEVGYQPIPSITLVASFGGKLWGGGQCLGTACDAETGLWRNNGTDWVPFTPPTGIPSDSSFVTALTVHGGRLVVAWAWGESYWQPRTRLAAWDGRDWSMLPGVFEGGQVRDLATFQGGLYAGGDFRSVDGQQQLGFCMLESSHWKSRGWTGRSWIGALEATDSLLIVGGRWLNAFDGTTWTDLASGDLSQIVALFADGPSLWVGGYITEVGGKPSLGVARWDGLPVALPPPVRLAATAVAPNPFRDAVALRFTLSRPGRVRLAVFDISGRVVARILDAEQPAGERVLEWDGRDQDGRAVRAGVYFMRLDFNGRNAHERKVVRIR